MSSGIKSLRPLCLFALLCFAGHGLAQAPVDQDVGVVHQKISVASSKEAQDWNYSFTSLDDFIALFSPLSLTILSKGETKEMYYAFARNGDNLYMMDWPRVGKPNRGSSISLTDANGNQNGVLGNPSSPRTLVALVTTELNRVSSGLGFTFRSTDYKEFLTSRIPIDPNFHGSLKVLIELWNDNSPRITISDTFPWK